MTSQMSARLSTLIIISGILFFSFAKNMECNMHSTIWRSRLVLWWWYNTVQYSTIEDSKAFYGRTYTFWDEIRILFHRWNLVQNIRWSSFNFFVQTGSKRLSAARAGITITALQYNTNAAWTPSISISTVKPWLPLLPLSSRKRKRKRTTAPAKGMDL